MNEGRPLFNASEPGGAIEADRVLIADRDELCRKALARALRDAGHPVATARNREDLERGLADPGLGVLVVDPHVAEATAEELLSWLRAERPELEVVVMRGDASVEFAVACMRAGAFDVLRKPLGDLAALRRSVDGAFDRVRWTRVRTTREAPLGDGSNPELVGRSQAMRRLLRTIQSLRHSESHVLIQGESGTGKELVARAVHAVSPRSGSAFVPVDCGALPESVIESELFGHEKGAFTGAVGAVGLFRTAAGGTLFLDEIGEIPLSVQAKLLRALQYKEVRPVGARGPEPVNLRVITATHRDLAAMVDLGRFRTDLYYRLNVVRIEIPPLRERPEDIPLLVQHFLAKYAKPAQPTFDIDDEALSILMRHAWPGNVRELENAIESALVFARGSRLRAADVPLARARRALPLAQAPSALPLSLAAYERSALERALRESGGNATEAARRLGIGRSTFYRKLSKLGVALSEGLGPRDSIR